MPNAGSCVVCGGQSLRPHLRVRGTPGPDGLIPTTTRFGVALGDIARCETCGHMQLDPLPDAEDLREAYGAAESADYAEEEAGQRATARELLRRIEALVEPGRILDVGCWLGFLLAEARDRGWEATGVDPSRYAAARARERFGLDVTTAGIETLPDGPFQAVTMADVIEHLVDPAAALDRVHRVLAPHGVLALVLPDAGSRVARALGRRWWSVLPTHVQYFTRGSLGRLLAARGFEVVETDTAPKAFTVGYYLGRIEGYSASAARVAVAAAARAGIDGRLWAPDFRDRMLVVARRAA